MQTLTVIHPNLPLVVTDSHGPRPTRGCALGDQLPHPPEGEPCAGKGSLAGVVGAADGGRGEQQGQESET